jgi:hypothetical protein
LAVGHGIEYRFLEMMAELDHLLAMATRAEPSSAATERQNILVMAIRAFYSGK